MTIFEKLKFLIKTRKNNIALKRDLKKIEKFNLLIKAQEIANRTIAQLKKQQKSKTLNVLLSILFIESISRKRDDGSLAHKILISKNIKINILNFSVFKSYVKHQIYIDDFKIIFYIVDVPKILLANFLILIIAIFLLPELIIILDNSRLKTTTNADKNANLSKPQLKNRCGDISVGGVNIWYPVYIDHNNLDLAKIRTNFCCDATYDPNSNLTQVASFHSLENANKFVLFLKNKGFKSARVSMGSEIIAVSSENPNSSCKVK